MAAEEDPFELIKKGNAFEAAADHWRSAEYYGRASVCLHRRADDLSSQIRNGGQVDSATDAGKWKVVSLFRAQSLEYLYKARHFLLEALRFENDQDRSRTQEVARTGTGSLDPLCSMITLEESEKRKLTFERVFSGGGEALESKTEVTDVGNQDALVESTDESKQIKENGTSGGNSSESHSTAAIRDTNSSQINSSENIDDSPPTEDEIDDRQQSIESRLAKLDSSLLPKVPPPFVSGSRSSGGSNNQNRLEEIRRGLGRLGVSLPDNKGGESDLIPETMSAEDQIKLIIQQAKDEVRVEKGLHVGEGGESNGLVDTTEFDDDAIDENDSMFEGFEDDDEYDIDTLLAKAENLVAKTGIGSDGEGKFSSELVHIRKIQALLLEARLCLEMEQAKSSGEQMLPKNSKETEDDDKRKDDMSDDASEASEDSVENDHTTIGSKLAARKKARELIENAQDCMKKILKDWK